jgi:receptor protein-tyrosine kinase
MTGLTAPRSHLAERAVAAMGPLRGGDTLAPETFAPSALAPNAPGTLAPGGSAADFALPPRPNTEPFGIPPLASPSGAPPAIGMDALRDAGLAFEPEAERRSRLAEELLLIQNQVLRAIPPVETVRNSTTCRQLVMVTSARPEEGKSFIALNIASSIAASTGQAVVLVDVDGSNDALTDRLGVGGEAGLRSLAQDPTQPISLLLRSTAIPGLSVLPHGARLAGQGAPSGAALAAALRAVALALPRHVVVLDTPAALASSNAPTLAAMVGQVLLVVQAEETQRDAVEAALDVLEACPVLQLVLNRSRLSSDDSFGETTAANDA